MVCTGNICRSPMAEGFLRHSLPPVLQSEVTVRSAGTHGLHGNRAEPLAVKAASAHGVDISDHRARMLDAPLIRSADLVLAMERFHLDRIDDLLIFRCKYSLMLGKFDEQRESPEIEDPYGLAFDAYQTCANELTACMPGLIDFIRQKVKATSS
jgi:protein-tyrosine phosphatase